MTPNGLPDPQLTRLPTGDIMYTLHMPIGTTTPHRRAGSPPATAHRPLHVRGLAPWFLLTLCFTALQEKYVASKLTLILALRPVAFPERSFSTLSGTGVGYALPALVYPLISMIFSCWLCALAIQTACWRRWR
jgi:hypothetical protein